MECSSQHFIRKEYEQTTVKTLNKKAFDLEIHGIVRLKIHYKQGKTWKKVELSHGIMILKTY